MFRQFHINVCEAVPFFFFPSLIFMLFSSLLPRAGENPQEEEEAVEAPRRLTCACC